MRTLLLIILLIQMLPIKAQEQVSFDKDICLDMIALCNSYTFLDLYGSDSTIIPKDYNKEYQSEAIGMDNMYQIYRNGQRAVICFRGSTIKKESWYENFHAAMIPAKGVIKGDLGVHEYQFASSEEASIHSGYSLALVFIYRDLQPQLERLQKENVNEVIITGHSQGGALANLMFALLNNNPDCAEFKSFNYSVYSFAAPMVGNKAFTDEYNELFCETNRSFNFINREDPIPNLPFNYYDSSRSIRSKSKKERTFKENYKVLIEDIIYYPISGVMSSQLLFTTEFVSAFTDNHLSTNVEFPEFIDDVDFTYLGNLIYLDPFEYPEVMKDSSQTQSKKYERAWRDGKLSKREKKALYKKGSWVYQHKTYNYYVKIMEEYHEDSFNELERKYLVENL